MINIATIREERKLLQTQFELVSKQLLQNTQLLRDTLIQESKLKIGDVIKSKNQDRIYVISRFILEYNDFIEPAQEELAAMVYILNKSNTIDKKRKDYEQRSLRSMVKIGTYDFENDKFIKN